jgi:hypothetical protein
MDTGTADCIGEFQAVRNAPRTWEGAVPLTFTEVAAGQAADINVGWRPANDPDLSMVGGTLAHADFPPSCSVVTNTLPKPVHFDDTEHAWSIGAISGSFDVETVALHEFGHILGLAHSSVAGAAMLPAASSNSTKRVLTAVDIPGATQLYPSQDNWRWCRKCQGLAFGEITNSTAQPVLPMIAAEVAITSCSRTPGYNRPAGGMALVQQVPRVLLRSGACKLWLSCGWDACRPNTHFCVAAATHKYVFTRPPVRWKEGGAEATNHPRRGAPHAA